MARYVASVESLWERELMFEYLADFASIADWDPNVAARDGLRRRLGQASPPVPAPAAS